jgi:tetratricopeptide (TPR) repeat protein
MMGGALFASWLLLQGSFASPQQAFEAAESLYQEQRYDEAAKAYEAMRAQGFEDGTLYYNLANAYFKAGRLGLAVLNYERALALMPGDEDTRANLAFANELVADSVEPPPLPLLLRWAVDLYRRLRPGLASQILSVSFLLAGIAVTLLLTDRWAERRSAVLAALVIFGSISLLSGVALGAKLVAASRTTEAIVLTENAYVRSGPGAANPRLAEIHEGLKVRVLGEREGWYQVSLANGLNGWLPEDNVETIQPSS